MDYEARGWYKMAEEDVYTEGCIPKSGIHSSGKDLFSGQTIEECIEKIKSFFGVERETEMIRDSCDEIGRLDIQLEENISGDHPSKEELSEWRKGKCRLWLATYTLRIKRVQRDSISIAKKEA